MIQDFLDFIKEATCSYTTVQVVEKRLESEGFEKLFLHEKWTLQKGGKYYVNVFDTSLIAFCVGKDFDKAGKLMIAAAHTDQPAFVIKPQPEMSQGRYLKLNVEAYGGAILNTWLDRPLGIAGCVMTKGENPLEPVTHIFDSKKGLLLIPNLAIHFNRDVNKGVELNKQKDMIPVAGMITEELQKEGFLTRFLAGELGVAEADILDYQLYVYNAQEGSVLGVASDIVLAPRIDNLASVYACVEGICGKINDAQFDVIALFDHEEVGSRTKQGAASDVLYRIIKRAFEGLEESNINANMDSALDVEAAIANGFFLSLDGAHAQHPNQSEKYDPTNPIFLNDGVVIKKSANQSYATDAYAAAVVKAVCVENGISYKEFVNRSDSPGGSTLGAIASTKLPMRMADVGVPMLAMHSAMESTGTKDVLCLAQLVEKFM